MADNFIVEKDGKKYIYRSTSVYDQQTHKKRTVSEYVGRIDPVTGELIEKKTRSKQGQQMPGNGLVKHFGPSYVLTSVAETCGLRDDLRKAFGDEGDRLLAMSISLILSGGPYCYIEPEMESNLSRELLGLGGETPEDVHRSVIRICDRADSVEALFKLRCRRASSVMLYNHVYAPKPDTDLGWIDRGSGSGSESNYCIATDADGIPVFFDPCYDASLGMTDLRKTVDRLIGFGISEPMVVLDSQMGSADNLEVLAKTYISFLVPARKKTPAVKQMLSQVVKKRSDPRSIRHFGNQDYIVYDTELTVVPRRVPGKPDFPDEDNETSNLELVTAEDTRFPHVPMGERIIAHACLELGDCSDNGREAMQNRLSRLEARLMEMDPYEAVDRLREVAGDYSRFFDVRVVEGELEVKIRQKAVTASLNREGIFVLLTHGLKNWNSVMQCYACRNRFDTSLSVLRNNLTSDSEVEPTLMSRMMTQFTALVLWNTMDKRLRESGIEMSVPAAMQHLNTIMATWDGTGWQTTAANPRTKRIMEALHVRMPEGDVTGPTKKT